MNTSRKRYRELLARYLKPQWRRVAVLAVLLLINLGMQLANPQILATFIDRALAGNALENLLSIAALFIGLALATQGIVLGETYVAGNLSQISTNRLRTDLLRHCLHLDLSFHNARTPGELIERVDGDVNTLGNFLSRFLIDLLGSGLLLIGVLIQLWRIDARVGLALTVFVIITLLVLIVLRDVAVARWEVARQSSAELFGFIEERLAGTEDIRSSGAVDYTLRRFFERSRVLLRRELGASFLGISAFSTTIILFAIGTAIALGLGVYLFQDGEITLGTVYLIFRYSELLTQPIEAINRQIEDLQKAGASLSRVQELFSTQSLLRAGEVGLPSRAPSLEFREVTFGYEDEGSVLRDVSFKLRRGRVLGLLGRTGSGKTTLTRLLLRLYEPLHGQVCLDDVDINHVQLHALRQCVGIVTQDIQLFNASVRDNLTFFDPSVPDEHILHVLEELGLWSWYTSLAAGLDTRLAAGGGGLSAGQAQLLAFVRVFLKEPALVILDEASSRLDPATEQQLDRAITRLLQDRTAIIIAHRLGTVYRADEILILENGRIREHGSRLELMHDPSSHFAQLLQTGLEEALA